MVGRHRLAHLGSLIRRLSASRRDSSQYCSDVIAFRTGTGRWRLGNTNHHVGKVLVTPMTIISQSRPFVVGVDTHARNHVYAILAPTTGALIDTRSFPVTAAGISRAIGWVARRTDADADTLWVIEGAASYGASLAGAVTAHGYTVAEAPRMNAKNRHGIGKTDALDAHRIAATTLALSEDRLRYPRADHGLRQAVRILVTAREAMTKDRTRSVNALNAVVRGNELGVDARKKLSSAQISEIARWRSRKEELSVQVARSEAVRLAKHIIDCDEQIDTNEQQLEELVQASEAAPLLQEKGFGSVSAAKCLTAWSHHGRMRNQAAFAALAGVNPIPASSGNTVRYRLNRGGDRSLNAALHMVAISRMTHDPETLQYVEKRRAEHKTDREIRRCVKRYLARRIFRILNASTGSRGTF